MKKSLIILLTVFLGINSTSTAQTQQGEVNITAGLGYSLGMNLIRTAINLALVESDLDKIKATPILNGMIDYGVTPEFSVGGAYSYHQWTWEDRVIDSLGNSVEGAAKALRHNIGVRALFHFGDDDRLDLYGGGRIGTSIWKFTATNEDTGESISDGNIPNGGFTAQAILGARAYLSNYVAVNFEFGLGTAPYLFAGGVTFKIPSRRYEAE